MAERGSPSPGVALVIGAGEGTGATSSLRGSAGFAAFAAAKHGARTLAQSMARELGPRGIHVAHLWPAGAKA